MNGEWIKCLDWCYNQDHTNGIIFFSNKFPSIPKPLQTNEKSCNSIAEKTTVPERKYKRQ